jgi:hypothetical protein
VDRCGGQRGMPEVLLRDRVAGMRVEHRVRARLLEALRPLESFSRGSVQLEIWTLTVEAS